MTGQKRKAPERIDLAAELAIEGQGNIPVSLMGVDCEIRTSFTGEEVIIFGQLSEASQLAEVFDLVIADGNGEALWGKIAVVPFKYATKLVNSVIEKTGLYEGEYVALSPASQTGMAGAPALQDSDTTTD